MKLATHLLALSALLAASTSIGTLAFPPRRRSRLTHSSQLTPARLTFLRTLSTTLEPSSELSEPPSAPPSSPPCALPARQSVRSTSLRRLRSAISRPPSSLAVVALALHSRGVLPLTTAVSPSSLFPSHSSLSHLPPYSLPHNNPRQDSGPIKRNRLDSNFPASSSPSLPPSPPPPFPQPPPHQNDSQRIPR